MKPRNKDLPSFFTPQEVQGQADLVASESLPAQVHGKEKWEALGFRFSKPYDDDPLFAPAVMPDGWSKKPTDHSMWLDIVDAAGNKRGSVFYKAAFYDRDAFMSPPLTRYMTSKHYPDGEGSYYERNKIVRVEVCDNAGGGAVFAHSIEILKPAPPEGERGEAHTAWWDAYYAAERTARAECTKWLAKNRPEWNDSAAYWPDA